MRFCEQKWQLRVLEPYPPSYHFVAPVVCADGTEAALKLGVPGKEMASEALTLRTYAGEGAVRLLDADLERGALLLERLKPGKTLHSIKDDEEAVRIAAGVMRRIVRPVPEGGSFPSTQDWAQGLAKLRAHFGGSTGPLPERAVGRAEKLFAELNRTIMRPLLLHGDLHHGNILQAERELWLAIDPKGLIGEAEYGVIQFLLNHLPEHGRVDILTRRIDQFTAELGLNRERVVAWAFCHTMLSAWWDIEDNTPGCEETVQTALLFETML
ncbi:aminoglycoside phosphotransferase family protein [Paenibacillus ginsengarvi]|uniref:aminoglycoside phosphotransferase family protein n=1 Tax=Paenibacillus ginsengarvi TaxID=400777 RepID=UPI0018734C6D|nr:aminoglycoside phosphotransferase family protein [Paenibacillus ginsengarvi]